MSELDTLFSLVFFTPVQPFNNIHHNLILGLFFALVDLASMAYVQKESSVLAAGFTREHCRAQPKTSGKHQKEEAQITRRHPVSAC